MNVRFPLFAKILAWFFLNLVFLGLVFYGFFRVQFPVGLDWLLAGRSGDRIRAVSEIISYELNRAAPSEWEEVLERYSQAYQVRFLVVRNDGEHVAGESLSLPVQVQARIAEGRPPFPAQGRPSVPFRGRDLRMAPRLPFPTNGFRPEPLPPGPAFVETRQGPARPISVVHTTDPSRYWILIRLPVADRQWLRPSPMTLLAVADSIFGGGLFFDLRAWTAVGCGVIFFSVVFWLPLVRSITRSISQITAATEEITHGRFDTRVQADRRDELGRLGQAINQMAARLEGYVTGQKRFLGDIAHELCSPIARVQMALGILEQRADAKQKAYVEDVREEVQEMTSLVNELLSFSKAGLRQQEIQLKPVQLAAIAKKVLAREASESDAIKVEIDPALTALAEPELLTRALANLVRNAIRYAAAGGSISVAAARKGDRISLLVADDGPGVPEETLAQIFDPFFRVETSRCRETGGVGLGLAIVKTCVEACQGTVTARNRKPRGLEVEITLRAEISVCSRRESG